MSEKYEPRLAVSLESFTTGQLKAELEKRQSKFIPEDELMGELSERFKQFREEKGLRQKDIAGLIGMNETSYVMFENYANPKSSIKKRKLSVHELLKLCNFYKVSIGGILHNIQKEWERENEQTTNN